MEELLPALLAGLVMALLGAAVTAALQLSFRRRHPTRIDSCPTCGGGGLDRRLTKNERRLFGPLVIVWALAFTAALFSGLATVLVTVGFVLGRLDATGLPQPAAFFLATATVAWLLFRPVAAYRARPPLRCRDCGHTWPAAA